MADLSNDEMVALCKEHLKFLREGRDAASAHIATSQEMIEQSRALIVQIDEQINRMERELGWSGGHARRGPEPETGNLICQAVLAARRSQSVGD